MTAGEMSGGGVLLATARLLLRPWRVAEAVVQRELWTERDPRVPPHRRIDAEGRPTLAEIEESIRTDRLWSTSLLAVERKGSQDVIGYCGLFGSDKVPDGGTGTSVRNAATSLGSGFRHRGFHSSSGLGGFVGGTSGYGPRSGSGTPHLAVSWQRSGSRRRRGPRYIRYTGGTCMRRSGSDAYLHRRLGSGVGSDADYSNPTGRWHERQAGHIWGTSGRGRLGTC